MDKVINHINEYISSVFFLKDQGKDNLCPIDNPIIQELLNDKFLYDHYKRKDTYAIKTRIKESLDSFCTELDNQATGNWIYDLTKDLDLPTEDD